MASQQPSGVGARWSPSCLLWQAVTFGPGQRPKAVQAGTREMVVAGRRVVMSDLPGTEKMDEEVFAFVRKTEEAVLKAARAWAKSVDEFVPVELPIVRQLVSEVFDFTEEVLKIQREFAHRMLHETRAAAARMAETAPRPMPRATRGPRPAHRATATKTTKAA